MYLFSKFLYLLNSLNKLDRKKYWEISQSENVGIMEVTVAPHGCILASGTLLVNTKIHKIATKCQATNRFNSEQIYAY